MAVRVTGMGTKNLPTLAVTRPFAIIVAEINKATVELQNRMLLIAAGVG